MTTPNDDLSYTEHLTWESQVSTNQIKAELHASGRQLAGSFEDKGFKMSTNQSFPHPWRNSEAIP